MGRRVSFTTKGGKRVSFTTGKKKSSTKRRSKPRSKPKTRRKTNKPRRSSGSVAKKRGGRRKSSSGGFGGGMINKIPLLRNKTVQKVALGVGLAAIVVTGLNAVAGQSPTVARVVNNPLTKPVIAFVADPLSGIVQFLLGSRLNGGNGGGGSQLLSQAGQPAGMRDGFA